jgi:hypothetical protein
MDQQRRPVDPAATRAISPGPYTLAEASTTIPIKDANGKTIASVKFRNNDLADAKLLAASYELIALARRARALLAALPEYKSGSHFGMHSLVDDLQQAIRKVEE